ncbi:hypothetical protein GQ53DRAFT_755088 [Thozetella sp. PMI_491]|nr:hypothetical protein GQ53DRAFT_755088 [Thozetella sp. PMI_491]
MAPLVFATPLPQSSRSEVLEWRFPKPYHQYTLTGRSRAAWHTSFVIPQLNLLLDAGLCVNKQRPKHIFLTHGHSDHTLLTPAFIKREDPPDIFCPVEMKDALNAFLLAKTVLNKGGLFTAEEIEGSTDVADEDVEDDGGEEEGQTAPAPQGKRRGPTHVTHGIRAGDTVPLRRTANISATAFACDHTVPSLGYVFSVTTQKLKADYTGLAGPEIKRLREQGVPITGPVCTPMFAFLGDTQATTLATEPDWLKNGIPVVITECSFLREKHRAQAQKTKHTIWGDLEPVVRKWPRTTFVIMHFSLRYSDSDVRQFFSELEDPPENMVIWIDGEPE